MRSAHRLSVETCAHFGVTAAPTGVNDVSIGGPKVYGTAQVEQGTALVHSGTFLVNARGPSGWEQ